jgi:ribosomal protein S18 acetylase RimI-like enzyme
VIRPAAARDADALGEVWSRSWRDGHIGHVPDALVAVRTDESFRRRAATRVPDTTVAEVDGEVAGFVMVAGDEVEQVFVSAQHRGQGIADALLQEAERQVRENGHRVAWLAVVAGNARARAFYERMGWRDEGSFDYEAKLEDGRTLAVPCHRYVKDV